MFKEKLEIGVRGNVKIITENDNGIESFEGPNTINEAEAFDVILSCLCRVPNSLSVDTIVFTATTVDGPVDFPIPITNSELNLTEKSITFIAQVLADSFEGTITDLTLIIAPANLFLASKTGLSVEKDNTTNVEVRWTITLSACAL